MDNHRRVFNSGERVRKKRFLRTLALFCLLSVSVFDASLCALKYEKILIKYVAVSGNNLTPAKEIIGVSLPILNGWYFHLLPKNNVLIYPREELTARLSSVFPRIETIDISRAAFDHLLISVKERVPAYVWCDDEEKPPIDKLCFHVDAGGFSFAEAPKFSNHTLLEFYGGDKRGGYTGKQVLPENVFTAIVNLEKDTDVVLSRLAGGRYYVTGVTIDKEGDFDFLISDKKSDFVWKIIFNLEMPGSSKAVADSSPDKFLGGAKVVANNFLILSESARFLTAMNKPNSRPEYIDLRFGKKVFYKFQKDNE